MNGFIAVAYQGRIQGVSTRSVQVVLNRAEGDGGSHWVPQRAPLTREDKLRPLPLFGPPTDSSPKLGMEKPAVEKPCTRQA